MNTDDYNWDFPKAKRPEALKIALETRKFEIELYWKRAAYFWTFISIAFAAYGYAQQKSDVKEALSFLLSCVGLVLSLSWFLANRGSKQWQENWEHHVDHLEDEVIGPLFKTTLPRDAPCGFRQHLDHMVFGPGQYSVSKINQLISLYITLIWLVLVFRTPASWDLHTWAWSDIAVLFATAGACTTLFKARTHLGPHVHERYVRKSTIKE